MDKKKKEFKHRKECWYGRLVAMYINRNRRWLKIGSYCNQCGVIKIGPDFENGIPSGK